MTFAPYHVHSCVAPPYNAACMSWSYIHVACLSTSTRPLLAIYVVSSNPAVQLGVSCIHVACISTSARTLLATYVVSSSLLLCKSLVAMSHTKIDDFKQALAGASEVIRLQTAILTAEQMDKVLIGLQDSLLIKAASLPAISIPQVQDIVEQVRVSVLTEGQKSKLTTVLTSRCMQGLGEETGAATKAQCQSMQAPSRYLTGQDWKELQDPTDPVCPSVPLCVHA